MISLTKIALIFVCAVCWTSTTSAQVFLVEPIEKGFLASSEPTPTFLWPGTNAKVVLIVIPGGYGHFGLASEQADRGGFFHDALKPLSDPSLTSGNTDVVIFDSPYSLPDDRAYPTSRATSDHLSRIESVVRYYKKKLNKPVWLMGHSNGAVSVTEFWKNIHSGDKRDLISGLVVSSSRTGISFPDDTNIPVLFIHHEKDSCPYDDLSSNMNVYKNLKEVNNNKVKYVLIKGGESEPRNNCTSGYHMYFGAGLEVAKAIDNFITN